jgi:hypothetical protein
VVSAPVAERLTLPLPDDGAPSRPVLPFRAAVILLPPIAVEAPRRSRARTWIRIALIVLGLLVYAGAILFILAPISRGPR